MLRVAGAAAVFPLLLLAGCADHPAAPSPVPSSPVPSSPVRSAGATHTNDTFFATAACQADIGYNIRFGGPRVLVRHVAGTDTTLSFRTQEFQGWRLPETTFTQATVDFEVLGGAEMFNIKRDDAGALHVRIHEGTLVFAALDGSAKVVARHIIRVNPGRGAMVNEWRCRVVG